MLIWSNLPPGGHSYGMIRSLGIPWQMHSTGGGVKDVDKGGIRVQKKVNAAYNQSPAPATMRPSGKMQWTVGVRSAWFLCSLEKGQRLFGYVLLQIGISVKPDASVFRIIFHPAIALLGNTIH